MHNPDSLGIVKCRHCGHEGPSGELEPRTWHIQAIRGGVWTVGLLLFATVVVSKGHIYSENSTGFDWAVGLFIAWLLAVYSVERKARRNRVF